GAVPLGHPRALDLVVVVGHARGPARGSSLRLALGGRLVAAFVALVAALALGRGLRLGVALRGRRVAAGRGRRGLLALGRLCGLVVLRGLLGLGFLFGVSHRSRLPNVWLF